MTHWSSRLLGAHLGLSNVTIAKVWRKWGLAPWRVETCTFSTDPELDAKVRDVVGLYLAPPDKAIVLCVDESPRSRAPAGPRNPAAAPPDPRQADPRGLRHGTTTLFAALQVTTGKVTDACHRRHRNTEFGRSLKLVANAYPGTKLHIVCDNYANHKHPTVKAWLGKNPADHPALHPDLRLVADHGRDLPFDQHPPGDPPRHLHLRERPVKDLIGAIETFIDGWNDRCQPFVWTKTADQILDYRKPGPRTSFTRQ